MTKKSKAARIAKMLKAGESASYIKRMLGVSESYIYVVKNRLAAGVEPEVEPKAKKTTILSVDKNVFPEAGEFIQTSTNNVDAILNERGSRYGNFLDHATITYQLKEMARDFAAKHNKHFAYDQCEALDMIFHKLGRILNGDPNYADSWIDIAGYAQLVADRLEGKIR